MAVKIRCINKANGDHDNPHEGITHFGWVNEQTGEEGKSSRADMVAFIDNNGVAYVRNGNNTITCYTRQGKYYKFVQTYADNTPTDNLLELPECR